MNAEKGRVCVECGQELAVRAGGLTCVNLRCGLRGLDADLVERLGRPS